MSEPGGLQRQFYDMLMESQYWPAERVVEHQRSQLAQLLRHAKAQVPFYEHRLDAVLKPNGDIDWDRWNEIPVVTRADLQNHRDAMQARELPKGHGPTKIEKSSGSVGVPVETTHNWLEAQAGSAALLRAFVWHGTDFDKSLLYISGEDPSVGAWPTGTPQGAWGPPWNPGHGSKCRLNNLVGADQVATFLTAHDVTYVSAMPSRFEPAAQVLADRGEQIKLEAIFTRGESVTSPRRRLFKDVFGARLVELYAAEEAFKMAHTCPEADHYHVHAELGLVEILGDDGQPVAAGQAGQVVVTPFYSTAQPLVRYAIGDIAVRGAPCSCGRTLPVIDRIVGRTYHLFRTVDGRQFVPVVPETMSFDLGFATWQLAQVALDAVEFRYVMRPGREIAPAALELIVRSWLPPGFRIGVSKRDSFPRSASGKHALLLSELAEKPG